MIYVGSQARVSTQGGSGMKRLAWIIGASFALCVAPTAVFAQGNGLDLSVSGHSVRAAFDSEITLSGLDLSFEGMHNNDNGDVAGVGLGLRANANPGHSPVTALIGVKALWLSPDYTGVDSGYVLAIGGGVNYVLPQFNRLSFGGRIFWRSEEHTSELQSRGHLVCRLLPETHTASIRASC